MERAWWSTTWRTSAMPRQLERMRAAQAAAGSGDNGHAALQQFLVHRVFISSF